MKLDVFIAYETMDWVGCSVGNIWEYFKTLPDKNLSKKKNRSKEHFCEPFFIKTNNIHLR